MADPAASETTPLLAPNVDPEPTSDAAPPSAADRTVPVVIATWLELTTGVLSISSGVACAVIRSASPAGFHFPWVVTNMIPGVVFFSVVAVFFTIYNLLQLRRSNQTLPALLNFVVDLFVAVPLLTLVGQAWDSVSFNCSAGYRDTLPDDALRRCIAWGHLVMPILWFFVLLSGIVGFTALFLAIARCIHLFQRRGSWSVNWSNWRVPAGQLSVEFTIKFLRQEPRQDTAAALDRRETATA